MEADKLCNYLVSAGEDVDREFVTKCLNEYGVAEWWKGYLTCLRHAKKRRALREKRINESASSLLDHISDLTNGK